jgi:ComF family protein
MAERPRFSLFETLLDLLFPARCAGCGRRGAQICPPCEEQIPWLGVSVCPICASHERRARICTSCGQEPTGLDGTRAACRFEGIARKAIHDLKFRRVRGRAQLLAGLLEQALEQRPLAFDVLVPIPLGVARRRERGFNQSELIARQIGARFGVQVETSCLARTRDTRPQVGQSRDERRSNLVGVFECREPAVVAGRRVALVDDVMTTGATLAAGAEALKVSGASRVFGLVVAREV